MVSVLVLVWVGVVLVCASVQLRGVCASPIVFDLAATRVTFNDDPSWVMEAKPKVHYCHTPREPLLLFFRAADGEATPSGSCGHKKNTKLTSARNILKNNLNVCFEGWRRVGT
jgi:hypothetical protein